MHLVHTVCAAVRLLIQPFLNLQDLCESEKMHSWCHDLGLSMQDPSEGVSC